MASGGKRAGAGAKPLPPGEKRIPMTFKFPADVAEAIRRQDNQSAYLIRLVRQDQAKKGYCRDKSRPTMGIGSL